MPRVDRQHLDIYWITCKQPTPDTPVHRMIGMVHPGADRCTWLHCEGSPGSRRLVIEANRRFNSWSIESKSFLARVHVSAARTVEDQARAIPLQSCRFWAMYLILRIERTGLVPSGTYDRLRRRYGNPPSHEDYGPGALGPQTRQTRQSHHHDGQQLLLAYPVGFLTFR
jgi:hypothetical protein